MVGRLPDAHRAGQVGFRRAGDHIALVGPFTPTLQASELAKLLGEPLPDGLPAIDMQAVQAAQLLVRDAVRAGRLSSAHDIAEGGLAIALAECCLAGRLGAEVELPTATPLITALFGEGSGGFLVSGEAAALQELGEHTDVAVHAIGRVGDEVLSIVEAGATAGTMITLALNELSNAHAALAELFT
jgi:phosphoribosylformylglycinamidine (FGAM) synthase-like enzyme